MRTESVGAWMEGGRLGAIRELSTSMINKIAAGEVVERPASVVKELLENAIDSGASRIELSVERGGKDLVRVADDGVGMDEDDLMLAFRAHATSKLSTEEDLGQIRTLGFRGEALAAISSVAQVRCQTRRAEDDLARAVYVEEGIVGSVEEASGPVGTIMEVRHLFGKIPARRKYLKTDATESSHVTETFLRIALAHPTLHMTMRSGSKVVYDLPPVARLTERVATLFGRGLAEKLIWVESQQEDIHLWGYVADPSESRTSSKMQYLFLGGRYVRDRALSHALAEAYRGLLMVGRVPIAFLNLEIPPDQVDVNVHPTKIEVRFLESQRIYRQLLSTLRETFLASDLHAKLQAPHTETGSTDDRSATMASRVPDPNGAGPASSIGYPQVEDGLARPGTFPDERSDSLGGLRPDRREVASWFTTDGSSISTDVERRSHNESRTRPAFDRFGPDSATFPEVSTVSGPASAFDEFVDSGTTRVSSDQIEDPGPVQASKMDEHRFLASRGMTKALQLHDSYLVVETSDGMVVIDQHALHERILVEELRQRLATGQVESQRLLIPEEVALGPEESAEVLQRRDEVAKLGLHLEAGSEPGVVAVIAVPILMGQVPPELVLRDLAETLSAQPEHHVEADELLEDVINMIACKAAIKAGQRLKPDEIEELLKQHDHVAHAHHCPHGRPTALIFTKQELERRFGRI